MKMYKYISVFLISFMVLMNGVFASSFSISTTSKTVTIGSSTTLTIKASDMAGKFTISTSDSSVVSISSSSEWIDNTSKGIKLTAKKVGSAKITITPVDVTDYSGKTITGSKTVTITVKEKVVEKPRVKSSNSYLSSLTIDGYQLDSKFDKESLEYSVTVKEGTEKIKINAQKADSNASVSGTGEVAVTEGLNTFNLVVTAENGSKRTYVLKVTVKEYAPINVVVNSNEYSVVRKRKALPTISEYFIPKDITIGEDTIEGYYNENLDYQLVGLKDSNGKVSFYIYKDDKYTLYNEQVFNGKVLRIVDKEINNGYKKTSFKYNDTEIESYQEVKLDIIKNTYALDNNEIKGNNFYLFYAINMETGKEELYQYDSVEKTVQRYNIMILDMYKEQSDKYYLYLLCSILILGVSIITFSTIIICNNKKKKKKKINKKKNVKKKRIEDLEL